MNVPYPQDVKKICGPEEEILAICAQPGSKSELFPKHSQGYQRCMQHYLDSSSDDALFAVEPGSVEDLCSIISVLRTHKDILFAVKGGGHATNPGFSSTKGVHICMARFNKILLKKDNILQVEAGCLFDEVYKHLEDKGRNIVGGYNHQGIGVAGWLLGGGYSLKTNQFGLGIDNIVGFHIVLPDGRNLEVTDSVDDQHRDLFKALRGGGNNFGIVTRFDLRTHSQGPVYGGSLTYERGQVNEVKKVIGSVVEKNLDERFAMTAAITHSYPSKFELAIKFFFDAPKDSRPNDVKAFAQAFTDITHSGELKETEFSDFEHPGPKSLNRRGRWGTVMVSKLTPPFIDAVEKEAKGAADYLEHKGKEDWAITIKFKPYRDDIFKFGTNSAWPHDRTTSYGPMLVFFQWKEADDDFYESKMKLVLSNIWAKAIACQCTDTGAPVYSNMALANFSTAEDIYSENGLNELGKIRTNYDPEEVMNRAGGFRIPLLSKS